MLRSLFSTCPISVPQPMWVGRADILILHLVKHCLWSLQLPVLWTLPLAAHCFVSLEAAFIWTSLQFSFQRAAMVWPREHESGGVSLVVIPPPGLSFFIRRMGEMFSTSGCGDPFSGWALQRADGAEHAWLGPPHQKSDQNKGDNPSITLYPTCLHLEKLPQICSWSTNKSSPWHIVGTQAG